MSADSTRGESPNAEAIRAGRTSLGIEFGSTRIKACLVADDPSVVLAIGEFEWENQLVDERWTYSLDAIWAGLQAAYASLVADAETRHGVRPDTFGAIGVSAMMHGYVALDAADNLLVPFRTWRNTSTGPASAELSAEFGVNIPMRWSIAHLYQAVLDGEKHVADVRFLTTLAGFVHWKLTGQRVLGIGDASGMFPIADDTRDYDGGMLDKFDGLVSGAVPGMHIGELLPRVLVAGAAAGELTAEGAALLDPSGSLRAGIPLCPPEGDAGTGMVATNCVAPRAGNVSAGTSIFAMVVLEKPLRGTHRELDVVTTPAGDPVAMVHCNNGASELAGWVALFDRFATAAGVPLGQDEVYSALFLEALEGEPDAGGILAYNQVAGEPIAGLDDGRPLVVRANDSQFTLANFMRAQLYGVFATLSLGMAILDEEGVELDRMFAHGGVFRTAHVAQRFLAAALATPVSVAETASEGGAWGIAVLASYTASGSTVSFADYLRERVFRGAAFTVVEPHPTDVEGFASYLTTYRSGLAIERVAVQSLPHQSRKTS
ncbi:MAG: FGGY-family carbohydrate kinase [Terrimesophilobacter sp.]